MAVFASSESWEIPAESTARSGVQEAQPVVYALEDIRVQYPMNTECLPVSDDVGRSRRSSNRMATMRKIVASWTMTGSGR